MDAKTARREAMNARHLALGKPFASLMTQANAAIVDAVGHGKINLFFDVPDGAGNAIAAAVKESLEADGYRASYGWVTCEREIKAISISWDHA